MKVHQHGKHPILHGLFKVAGALAGGACGGAAGAKAGWMVGDSAGKLIDHDKKQCSARHAGDPNYFQQTDTATAQQNNGWLQLLLGLFSKSGGSLTA